MTNPKMVEELADLQRRMQGALDVLQKEFSGLRTGRASVNLLDPIVVDAYGSKMHIAQVGNINTPEARLITVQVWDQSLVKAVEKGIRDAGLGLNPMTEGQLIRIPLPELTQDRRQELAKIAAKYAEQARISVRNIRRDGMDSLKALEKDSAISEDEKHHSSDEVQKVTDDFVKKIDELLAHKEKEISHV